MKAFGKKICVMVKVLTGSQMEISMREIGRGIRHMGMVNSLMLTATRMTVCGRIIFIMARESKKERIYQNMMVNGKKVRSMALVTIFGQMELNSKEIG
jgi:hypothetical protein